MALNVTVAEQERLKRKLTVEVPLDEVQSTYEEVYHRLRTNIRVDGFRPGKYPRHLAEKRFQSVMAGEAMQTLVPKYFQQAVSELSMTPATEPHFDKLDIDKARPFRFEVEFEVVPDFKLLQPSAFTLKEQKPKVTPKDVEARIEELRASRATLADKGERPAERGDVVTFDFHGTLDGEDFEGGRAENQRIEVGTEQYLPEFDAEFPGIQAGASKEFDLTFPEDYGQGSLAGKTVHFRVTARHVEEKVLPELNEDFFKQFGDFAALKDLQGHIKEQLEQEQDRTTMQAYQNDLADQMRERYDFEVPETLVEHALHEFEHQLSHDEPDTLKDEAKLAERKAAERKKIEANLRVAYAVDALAKQYGVQVNEEEVRQRFYLQAYMLRQNPNELLKSPFGRRMLSQIEQSQITAKTLERLAEEVLSGSGGKGAAKEAPAESAAAAEAKPAKARGKGAAAGASKAAKDAQAAEAPAKAGAKAGGKAAKGGKGKSRQAAE
jgi:trigger factor